MRITNICLLAPVTDGWNYQDNLLTKYQKKNGNDVSIITSHWIWGQDNRLHYDDRDQYYNEDNVKIIRIKMKGREDFNKKFKRFPDLYKTIEKTNPDILFIHGVSFKDTDVVRDYLQNNPNVRAFADNHADFSNSATSWISKNILHKIIWKHYANLLVPYVETFYGVLPARVDFLTEVYKLPKEKCKMLPMGVDDDIVIQYVTSDKIPFLKDKYDINDNDFLIVTGGKIDKSKRQVLNLMEAINQINDIKVKLLIFGSVVDELKYEFNRIISNKIIYVGWATTDETYQYFAMADLVVFPGRHSVYWEQAAGMGKPLVVKKWLGTNHIDLGGNVMYIDKDSIDEIKNIILTLINDKSTLNKMRLTAELKARDYFSYRSIAKKSIE